MQKCYECENWLREGLLLYFVLRLKILNKLIDYV
jgi:hypothetical protein